jgi:hypothetical protein
VDVSNLDHGRRPFASAVNIGDDRAATMAQRAESLARANVRRSRPPPLIRDPAPVGRLKLALADSSLFDATRLCATFKARHRRGVHE